MPDDDEKDQQIQRLTKEAAEARRKLREAESKVEDLTKSLDKASGDHDKAVADAKAAGAAEAKEELTKQHAQALAKAEVRARAARKLADPDDADKFISLDGLLDKDGKPDSEAIDKALTELVEKKPYLAVGAGNGSGAGNSHRPSGNGDGGARTPAPANSEARMNDAIRQAVKH